MFGIGQGGMGGFPGMWPQVGNAFAAPTPGGPAGQGSAYGGIGQLGQGLMQQGMPRFAGQPGGSPTPQGFMGGFPGGLFSNATSGQFQGAPIGQGRDAMAAYLQQNPQIMATLPPQIQDMLTRVGQGQASGGANVYGPSQLPSRWGSPASLFGSMFNPSGYR